MKKLYLPFTTAILLVCAVSLPAQTVQKTLVRSFDLGTANEIMLDLNGAVTVQTWNTACVRVQMQIALDNVQESLLQTLVTSGRYNLKGEVQGKIFGISAPGLRKSLRSGDNLLPERITFTVFAPEGITVTLSNTKPEALAEGAAVLKPM